MEKQLLTEEKSLAMKQLLTVKEVSKVTGFSRSSIYQFFNQGIFPKPIKLGRSTRWRLVDVQDFLAKGGNA